MKSRMVSPLGARLRSVRHWGKIARYTKTTADGTVTDQRVYRNGRLIARYPDFNSFRDPWTSRYPS